MRWSIEGAEYETGKDVRIVVEAMDEKEALTAAKKNKIFVSDVRPIPQAGPSDVSIRASLKSAKRAARPPSVAIPAILFFLSLGAIIVGYVELGANQDYHALDDLSPSDRATVNETLQIENTVPPGLSENTSRAIFLCGCISLLTSMVFLSVVPGKIAVYRNHPAADAIRICGICGLFLGFIFWIVAFIWAHTKKEPLRV